MFHILLDMSSAWVEGLLVLGDALLEVDNLRQLLVRLGHVPGSVQEGTVQEEGVRFEAK